MFVSLYFLYWMNPTYLNTLNTLDTMNTNKSNESNLFEIKSNISLKYMTETIPITSDLIYLVRTFSQHFHEKSMTPDYYISGFRDYGRIWNVFEVDDPIKSIKHFLPNCRYNDRTKWNLFWKAERSGQSIMISQLLSNYLSNKATSRSLFYQNQPITKVWIQSVTVEGHKAPQLSFGECDSKMLIPNKEKIDIVGLQYDDKQLFVDLCGPQIDIYHYDSDNNCPIYLFENLEKDQLYAHSHNHNVKVIDISDPIYVENDSVYQSYLQTLEDEFSYEIQDYVDQLYRTYKEIIKRKIRNKKRNKKK